MVDDVKTPIIGVEFLSHNGLPADSRNKRLLDKTTQLSTRGFAATADVGSIKTIDEESSYHRLLTEFPALTRPPVFRRSSVRHGVQHHICTTPGTPVHFKPRRLAPDRLKLAKAEFEVMIEQGEMQSSRSPWSSPLHIVPRKDGGIRPCGDYRVLNARTIPDTHRRTQRTSRRICMVNAYFPKLISFALTINFRSRRKTYQSPRSLLLSVCSKRLA